MSNNRNHIQLQFAQLDQPTRITVLIAASFNLTIEFRGLHEASDARARAFANGLNELQHKLLSQALSELSNNTCYPSDVLMDIVFEIAESSGTLDSIIASLADAIRKFGKLNKIPNP